MQTLQPGTLSSINMKTVTSLAETFIMHPEEYMAWLIKIIDDFELSKTLFFLMLMQSFMMQNSMFSIFTFNCELIYVFFVCPNACDPFSFWTFYACLAHCIFISMVCQLFYTFTVSLCLILLLTPIKPQVLNLGILSQICVRAS